MTPPAETFRETSIDREKDLRWIRCEELPELSVHRIAHLGIADPVAPYRVVRIRPEGSFLLATTSGEGRVMLDGQWKVVRPGSLVMAPPRVLNAFYVETGKKWQFYYIRYVEPSFVHPIVTAASPVRSPLGGARLAYCIAGLWEEWTHQKNPEMLHHWLSLAQGEALRAARPETGEGRLADLWEMVGRSLETNWTLEQLASEAGCSIESLRRRCHAEMGRSPIQQVDYMRMQRAQALLGTTTKSIESISKELGYAEPLSFSRAFKRWVGLMPRDYRAK